MLKKILLSIIVLVLISLASMLFFLNTLKEFVVDSKGGSFEYKDVTLDISKEFTSDDFKLSCSIIKPKNEQLPFTAKDNKVYEFRFKKLDKINDSFKIFMPKTSELETPVGFLGVYEGNNIVDGFAYYPVMGELAEDKYFVFKIPAAALKNSKAPLKTTQNFGINAAYASGSLEGYILRWFLPPTIGTKVTENFRIFYMDKTKKQAMEAAAKELEDKYNLYSKMGYKLNKQKSMGKLNVYMYTTKDGEIDGALKGKKIGEYELYKYIYIDDKKDIKTIKDTATHELFHVAQMEYKMPLWLEEATATYMEKYSSAYKDYPVQSKKYYDLLFYQGFNETSTKEIKEASFGYALSNYIKFFMDKRKPPNDGVQLRKMFEYLVGRDAKTVVFEKGIGRKNEWITDFYVDYIGEKIYPYGDMGEVINECKKTEKDYSMNPESLVGKTLSFTNIKPNKPEVIQLNFIGSELITDDKVGFYYKDSEKQNNIDLIMVVSEIDTKNKKYKILLSEKLGKAKRIKMPKKYFSSRYYKTYLIAINKSGKDIKNYWFSLKTDQISGNIFEDINIMDATVSYAASGSEAAQRAYKAMHAKEPLTAQQRRDRWNSIIYSNIVNALEDNGKTYHSKCRVTYFKDKNLVRFSFGPDIYTRDTRDEYEIGYLTSKGAIFATVHKDSLIIREEKISDYKQYGKANMKVSENGRITVNMDVTREIYERGNHEGNVNMKIVLTN